MSMPSTASESNNSTSLRRNSSSATTARLRPVGVAAVPRLHLLLGVVRVDGLRLEAVVVQPAAEALRQGHVVLRAPGELLAGRTEDHAGDVPIGAAALVLQPSDVL